MSRIALRISNIVLSCVVPRVEIKVFCTHIIAPTFVVSSSRIELYAETTSQIVISIVKRIKISRVSAKGNAVQIGCRTKFQWFVSKTAMPNKQSPYAESCCFRYFVGREFFSVFLSDLRIIEIKMLKHS